MNLKPVCLLLSLAFLSIGALAQNPASQKPFTLEGKLKNFAAKQVYVSFYTEKRIPADTITLDENGNFYYQTTKIKEPGRIRLFTDRQFFFNANLLVAPGYHFTLTADCKTESLLNASKKITGRGAEGSVYLLKIDSLARVNQKDIDFGLDLKEFLAQHNSLKRMKDSVWNVVYGGKKAGDKTYAFFKEMTRLDNLFYRLDVLTYRAVDTTLTYKQTVDFIKNNCDPDVLADLYNPHYLISSAYKTMMQDGYFMYLKSVKKKQGVKFNRINYQGDYIRIIADNYKGDIREKALITNIRNAITYARSFEEINNTRSVITPLLPQLKNLQTREEFTRLLSSKETELLNSAIGKPAPVFTATDINGKQLSIADYKGRVVLIDLWASWCGPCRAETPFIERLVQKYQEDKRLTIMSVGVLDEPKKWKIALETDKPSWLQLYDTDKSVERLYSAYSIPKFIIINKEGNIVSFDAPMPSDGNSLEKILMSEMAK